MIQSKGYATLDEQLLNQAGGGIRDEIKSPEKFTIRSSFKIGGREGVQWGWLFKIINWDGEIRCLR